jgi:4-hydroxy-2-oxoglutarate aldolase
MATMDLSGVLTPIPTPFDERDEIDLGRLRRALAGWLTTRLTGFVVLGSNGEAALLDEDESDRVVGAARDVVPAGRTFIVGTGRESTRGTVAAAARAAALGADAVLVRTPGFFKVQMTADAFVQHYTAVADRSPVPVLLYNFTAVTGVTLPVDAVAVLSRHPNIVGMKESGGDVPRIADLVAATPDDFAVLAGSPSTFHASLCVGATGGILALGSVAPEACVRLFELTRAARQDEARALQQRLLPLAKLIGSTYGVPGLKAALELVGCDTGWPRPPLMPLHQAAVAELADAVSALDLNRGLVAL